MTLHFQCCGVACAVLLVLVPQLWVLTGTGVLGQMQTATQNVHLALNADVGASWAPGGRRDLVLVTATGNARLAVNLDTANNGFGGIDHAVMLSATASPSLNFLNGWVQIGTLGTVSADVYWRVSVYQLCELLVMLSQ